ncbi:helix-turn-helix domain-containing protein [Haladaptatus sp. DYSN1]|uniref:helix-turn-helix transcriptional regulator n=2 Tax=Haladaptatus TaxID=367188 RepID=UPI002405D1E8|nr:helix-turn-helix domain-containing protein [Haladaptatus sp. DYSN1]
MKGLSAACLAFLLVFAATAPAVAAPPDNPEGSSGSIAAAQEFDRTEFIVEIYENGSARWTFSYRWTLETDEDRQQFNQYATEFNENETELYKQFQNQSQALATSGEQATGRTMSASDFSKQAYVSELGNEGIVEMQFTWSNFAQTGDDQVVVGDVFEGGLYIGPNQSFVIKHDGPLQFAEAEPEPGAVSGGSLATSDSLTWFEDTQFADQQPRVVLAPPGSDLGQTTTDDSIVPEQSGNFPLIPAAVVFFLLAIAAGAFAYRSGAFPTRGGGGSGGAGAGAIKKSSGGGTSSPTPAAAAVADDELLTDEDRVLKMLQDNGGRMRQVNIVDETGWSKSKVSMLLSDMEDDGLISKLRMGRENIVSLSGQEPEATRSALDDE